MNTPTPTAEHVKEAEKLLCPNDTEYVVRIGAIDRAAVNAVAGLVARYAAKEAECERLRSVVKVYADKKEWSDSGFGFQDVFLCEGHGYTLAQQALTDTPEPSVDWSEEDAHLQDMMDRDRTDSD